MIYALEWYDVPRKDYGYLVEYHPYLTRGDLIKLEQLNSEHLVNNTVTFGLTSIIANRFLQGVKSKFFSKYMEQRFLRAPLAFALGGLSTYLISITIMRTVYQNDLKDLNLDKYYELDLDADMMRQDLQQMGINVDATYFDKDHVVKIA
jgi:hypothetical protein